jgi:hypothetical protein
MELRELLWWRRLLLLRVDHLQTTSLLVVNSPPGISRAGFVVLGCLYSPGKDIHRPVRLVDDRGLHGTARKPMGVGR